MLTILPPALVLHLWHHRTAAQKQAAQVHGHEPIPLLQGNLFKGHTGHGRTLKQRRVVDQAVQTSKPCQGHLGHMFCGLGLRHIHLHRQGLLPTRTQCLGHRLGTATVDVGHHHPRPFACQTFTVGTAKAMRPSGHNNHPLLESSHGRISICGIRMPRYRPIPVSTSIHGLPGTSKS